MWGKSYRNSYAICISCFGLAILMCTILKYHLQKLNRKLEAEQAELAHKERSEVEQIRGDGTDVPVVLASRGFRYML
jgi:hypothetical protein